MSSTLQRNPQEKMQHITRLHTTTISTKIGNLLFIKQVLNHTSDVLEPLKMPGIIKAINVVRGFSSAINEVKKLIKIVVGEFFSLRIPFLTNLLLFLNSLESIKIFTQNIFDKFQTLTRVISER